MRIAIISDIHSNLEALQTCIGHIEASCDADMIACLGDIVGYGADPGPCIDIVREKAEFSVIGNHDAAVAGTTGIEYFNYIARDAVMWTRERLSEDQAEYLKSLPYTRSADDVLYSHATPADPQLWHYISSWADAQHCFQDFEEKVCFVGHSHVPGIYSAEIDGLSTRTGAVKLNPGTRCIINIGSVGQPRDGDPRLSFAMFDSSEWSVEIIRLEYDAQAAGRKIRGNGLPPFLAERILIGR